MAARRRDNVLRALNYFHSMALLTSANPNPRLREAIVHIRSRYGEDRRWVLELSLPGRAWFQVNDGAGKPSPWVTLRSIRVLKWWDNKNTATVSA